MLGCCKPRLILWWKQLFLMVCSLQMERWYLMRTSKKQADPVRWMKARICCSLGEGMCWRSKWGLGSPLMGTNWTSGDHRCKWMASLTFHFVTDLGLAKQSLLNIDFFPASIEYLAIPQGKVKMFYWALSWGSNSDNVRHSLLLFSILLSPLWHRTGGGGEYSNSTVAICNCNWNCVFNV